MKTEYRKWIGERLKYFRTEQKLTPGQLAGKIPMNKKTYGHYEDGYTLPSIIRLKAICEALSTSLDKFMEGSPAKEVDSVSQFEPPNN